MKSSRIGEEPTALASFSRGALLVLWHAVRLPVFAFLVILEPFVRFILAGAAVICVPVAFVLEYSGAAPNFSFWGMIAFAIGCMLLLMLYYGVMRLFSR